MKIHVVVENNGYEGYSSPIAAGVSEEAAIEAAWAVKEEEMREGWKSSLTKEYWMSCFWSSYVVSEIELSGVD